MNEEYKKRYNKTFIPFHNPIDTLAWSTQSKSDYSVKNAFILLYAGRIGTGITTCLLEVAEAIKGLNKKGLKFVFRIQTHANHPVLNQLKQYPFVEIAMPSAYESLPAIFASADALLLANDFDAAGISFLKYSMPTKASEYMASGTPILVYSPEATAVAKHAKNHKWALVVDNKNSNILKGSISRLYSEIDLRSELGSTAKQFANEQYNSSFVRANFRKEFVKILSEN
jgi:glycosyltransferase involved in cell wall biosynthesis